MPALLMLNKHLLQASQVQPNRKLKLMGSRSQLLMRLLGQEKVSKDEIRELKEYLKKLEE